jgi:predicted lysophospholipase L1 biosynthesis ABC-type transport system permease subunit
LPFGLALGVSRRSYYIGTAVLAVATAVVYGLALTVLNVIEGSTGGWGVSIHVFRVPYLLDGPWYLTWLTSLVGPTLLFVYGTWYGLV